MHNFTQKSHLGYASYARVMQGLHNHNHPVNKGKLHKLCINI